MNVIVILYSLLIFLCYVVWNNVWQYVLLPESCIFRMSGVIELPQDFSYEDTYDEEHEGCQTGTNNKNIIELIIHDSFKC